MSRLTPLALAIVLALSAGARSASAANRIAEYDVGVPAYGLATNPDGSAIYFTNGGSFSALFPSDGTYGPLAVPGASNLHALAATADTFWIAETSANKIWSHPFRSGVFTPLVSPTAASLPIAVTTGPDGNLWYTEFGGNKVVRVSPVAFTEYPLPHPSSEPYGIVGGHDGKVWFVETAGNRIGNVSTETGALFEHDLPDAGSLPTGIAMSSRYVAFTEPGKNRIGVWDPLISELIEYPIPTAASSPQQIVWGVDGAFWFTEAAANKIGRLDMATRTFTEVPIPTSASQPNAIIVMPNGDLAFAEEAAHRIGILRLRVAGDVNGDGSVSVADVFHLIGFLFAGGPAPK